MDRLQAIELFMRVVDLGSFSKAAADLGMGQPTATKLVASLEKQLGSRLLHRSALMQSRTKSLVSKPVDLSLQHQLLFV